jgi:bisphosphoglycerate-independent phosphoglycerate mutase (AlkP superfamily)
VPLILTAHGYALEPAELSDLAPTCLALLGLEQPAEMTGRVIPEPT